MMKRLLCIVLCLMLAVPAAMAETADTLPKLFARQLTGGNGIRGKISITASGVAEWLNVLLPFTATDIQLRAVGQKQGDMSELVDDDDDWQIHLYAENSAGEEVGTTWLYGNPQGMYVQSDLLPDTLLTMPVEKVNLLYQLFKGEFSDLFFAFDPFELTAPGPGGNIAAYPAVAEMMGIPAEEWENNWMPVLEKYLLHLDLWLTSYGDPSFVNGEEGALTMSATYTIPSADLKEKAKELVGQILYDSDLQNLLLPYVTMEQRVTYLNPSMVYFYETCIDALPLEGDVILSREMSAMGEIVSTTVALPLPHLPADLIDPLGQLAADVFALPYTNLLQGMNRVSFIREGGQETINLSGEKRTLTLSYMENVSEEYDTELNGSLKIIPNVGVDENSLSASFSYAYGHRIWQDESYIDHDTTEFTLAVEPDLDMLNEDDPFRNTYIDFDPIMLEWTVDYRNNAYQANSAVQINVEAAAKLPDAEIGLDMVMRITTKVQMMPLETAGGENLLTLTDERKAALLETLTANAVQTMVNLNAAVPEVTLAPAAEPTAEPTAVPPVTE